MIKMKNVKPNKFGVFVYRKVVPEHLRTNLGRREFIVSLGTKNKKEALIKAVLAEAEIDEKIAHARSLAGEKSSRDAIRQIITGEDKAGLEASKVALPAIQAKAASEGKTAISNLLQAAKARPSERAMSLTKMLKTYLADMSNAKSKTKATKIKYERDRTRWTHNLIEYFNGIDKNIRDITRADIREYIETRKKQVKASSLNTEISTLKAMFGHGLLEIESNKPNPFDGLKVNDEVSKKDKKRSFNPDEIRRIMKSINSLERSEIKSIALLTAYTGCRESEIIWLDYADIDLDGEISSMMIQENEERGLKTKASKRVLPIHNDLIGLFEKGQSGPVFKKILAYKYPQSKVGRELNTKILRSMSGVHDRRATWHSWRHTIKDALKNTGCVESLENELTGHAQHGMNAVYGDGFSLKNKKKAMDKAIAYMFR